MGGKQTEPCHSTVFHKNKQKRPLSKRVKSDMRYIPRTELHHLRNLYRSHRREQLFILAPSLLATATPTPLGLHLTNWNAGAEPKTVQSGDRRGRRRLGSQKNPWCRVCVGSVRRRMGKGAWPSMNVVIHKNKELLHSERDMAVGCLFIFVRAKIIFVMLLSSFHTHACVFCRRFVKNKINMLSCKSVLH